METEDFQDEEAQKARTTNYHSVNQEKSVNWHGRQNLFPPSLESPFPRTFPAPIQREPVPTSLQQMHHLHTRITLFIYRKKRKNSRHEFFTTRFPARKNLDEFRSILIFTSRQKVPCRDTGSILPRASNWSTVVTGARKSAAGRARR